MSMISDITIGQYYKGDSFVHKLDPRAKIILTVLFVVMIFLCKNFFSLSPQAELISNVSNRVTWQAIKVSTWLRIKNSKK